jgi:hypothetical protein
VTRCGCVFARVLVWGKLTPPAERRVPVPWLSFRKNFHLCKEGARLVFPIGNTYPFIFFPRLLLSTSPYAPPRSFAVPPSFKPLVQVSRGIRSVARIRYESPTPPRDNSSDATPRFSTTNTTTTPSKKSMRLLLLSVAALLTALQPAAAGYYGGGGGVQVESS